MINETLQRPRRVILTDWAADVDSIKGGVLGFVQRIQLLSLLYDEILIPDEFVALSEPLSRWFSTDSGKSAWSELLDIGSLIILKHPESAYDDTLRPLAVRNPISTRAKQIGSTGTKYADPFVSNEIFDEFHRHVDASLINRPSQMRQVGAGKSLDIMQAFGHTLSGLTGDSRNEDWLEAYFPTLGSQDLEKFGEYANDPQRAIADSNARGFTTNVVISGGKPVFNRSLAFQVARTFPEEKQDALQRLVQSAFAAPFCWREDAIGQFGNRVHPIPLLSSDDAVDLESGVAVIQAEAVVPIKIPSLAPGFGGAIAEVRNSQAGQALREAISGLGSSTDLGGAYNCWSQVASELSRHFACTQPVAISLHETMDHFVKKSLPIGILVHFLSDAFSSAGIRPTTVTHGIEMALMHEAGALAYDGMRNAVSSALAEQRGFYELERALQFNCTYVKEPSWLQAAPGKA